MDILLQRYSDDSQSTQGNLFIDRVFFCHTIEDEHRDVKLKGETRIPKGLYELRIRREDTPLTVKHRKDYGDWFKYHIEVTGVKDFTGIYIHAGNNDSHTDGCLLLADTIGNNQIEDGQTSRSIQAVKRFYLKVYPLLERGQRTYINIQDEKKIFD